MAIKDLINKKTGDKLYAEEWNTLAREVLEKQPKLNIIDALDSSSSEDVLSAKQGKILKELIDESNEGVSTLSSTIQSLPIGYFYGTYETDEELEQLIATEQGYAYVGVAPDYIVYVYKPEIGWNATDNKYGVPQLETDLNTKSTAKAPTTKAVADGIDSINVTIEQEFTNTQKEIARNNIKAQEDISTMQDKFPIVAALNDRPADEITETGVVKAFGYKVLNPELTFTSQVQNDNTIYEIRDEFNLDNGKVTLPSGCTLKFNGGRVINGSITGADGGGNFNVQGLSVNNGVFISGYNIPADNKEEYLDARSIGMIDGSEEYKELNGSILERVIAAKKWLTAQEEYYIKCSNQDGYYSIDYNLKINGNGTIRFLRGTPTTTVIFYPVESEVVGQYPSFDFNNVTIYADDRNLIGRTATRPHNGGTEGTVDFLIDHIVFENCKLHKTALVRMRAADVDYSQKEFGLNRFVVKNCKITDITTPLSTLTDFVVAKEYLISGNNIDKFVSLGFAVATTNTFTKPSKNKKYQCDFIVENNVVMGKAYQGSSYYTFIQFETGRVFYRNNVVSNVISMGLGQVSYDAYCSCDEYYCENNIFTNIVRSNNPYSTSFTPSEIFKSKAAGAVRVARGNRWFTDFDECSRLTKEVSWNPPDDHPNDEYPGLSKNIALFGFTGKNPYVEFTDNLIEIKGGNLRMNSSGAPVVECIVNRNTFKLDSTTGSLIPYWGGDTIDGVFYQYLEKLEFCGNVITVKDKEHFYVACSYAPTITSNIVDVRIENNVSNVLLGLPSRCKRVIFRNNILTDTTDIIYPSWMNDKYYSFDKNSDEYVLTTKEPSNWKTNYMDYYTKSGDEYSPVIGVTKLLSRSPVKVYKPVDSQNSYIETPFIGVSSSAVFNDDKYQLNNIVFETPRLPISDRSYFFVFNVALNQKLVIELPEIGLKQIMIFIKDGEDDVYVKNEVGDIITSYKLSNISGNSAPTMYIYTPEGEISDNYQKIYYNLYKKSGGYARFIVNNPSGKLLPRIRVTYLLPTITSLKNDSISKGIESFDKGKPNYWNGSKWVDADGFTNNDRIGTINNRPLSPQIGFCFIYTKTGLPIFWKGDCWITASGEFVVDNSGSLADRLALTPRKGQQFQQTIDGSTVNLIYGDYGWLKATDGTPWFDDSGTLNAMYDKYNYILLTSQPDDWPTKYNTYYKIVDGVYTLLTTSEAWALDKYYKKDVNVYKGIQVKLTDIDTVLSGKVVKWDGTKFINVVNNVALKAGTPTIVFNTENDVTTATITSTSNGKIYYTKDGIDPKSSSTEYSSPITLSSGDQIKAICIRDHVDNSDICFVKVATPSIDFSSTGILSITCDTPDVKIYYTTNGSTPDTSSTEYNSSESITIAKGVTIKAFAVLIGRLNSDVKTEKRS